MPGGVSRNTIYRKPNPDYADFGRGCYVTDVDGIQRVDMANNMASLIHGHAHPQITASVVERLHRGTAFTMTTDIELQLAKLLCDRVPWFQKIRFMNSGTEAVMASIKAARAITGRPMIAKAEGTYHGTYDFAEVSQNSTPENWGPVDRPASIPVARGTPDNVLDNVVVFPFNDTDRTIDLLDRHADQLACILIDLIPQRAGLIPARQDYIAALRDWSLENEVLLVFDEVISFRLSYSGAAEAYDVEPDLTTLGKIIGGGLPVGALTGKTEYMAVLDPTRDDLPFPWSGTFSANPITMTAGMVAMELFDHAAIRQLNALGDFARNKINALIQDLNIKACVTGTGSMFRIHPKINPPTDYRSTWQNSDEQQRTCALVDHLYRHGFMFFRTCTAALSTPTGEREIEHLVEVLRTGLPECFSSVQGRSPTVKPSASS